MKRERGRALGRVECNPKTARKIATADGVTLYKTKSRQFFTCDADGELALISANRAVLWLVQYYGDGAAELAFADEKEVPTLRVTLDLPAELVEKIDAARDDERRSRRAVIQAALEREFR